ncbi:zinc finger protein 492-like [Hemicordylus capensis]|uniref:zinc finger protein 492-like n=1 Tax=Hemicordylus capensis TaxID=884348 RepID=UPI0023020B22|nr:zinc finger protein 492-like [Hemicordylus capensis]XP_053100208.1 zinc finger protein 492-like [Hemicordylus capensis]XP_053100209.1 zinc finger protein 492-like [Hemicordylus capensis]XP_053100210.1 zinc finger protein 492-like [Hemicordylus capensis]XP_053100211.1 zinc finger protein 492-like [Hemicordylus capensis]XP_053100212.1 zinc finger protein 492-like [Hemicordylus capensis]
MMEMQVFSEPEDDACNTRRDHLGASDCASDIGLLMEVEEDYLPPSAPDSNSDAPSGRLDLPPKPPCKEEENSLKLFLKASTYFRQWDSATSGVYVPAGNNYNLHFEGKKHLKDLPNLREEEDNFIILINSSDDENLPPLLGKFLHDRSRKNEKPSQGLSGFQEHRHSYWCHICGKEFFRAANLRMHKLTHSTDRPHKCPECGKGFIRTADVWRHLHSLHKIERSSVVFGSANLKNPWSVLQQNQDDSRNLRELDSAIGNPVAKGSNRYLCQICGKDFGKANLLSKHKLIHQQEKPYKCKECGKAFIQLTRLKRHHQTHTRKCPFSCEACGQAFACLDLLQRHQRIHTERNPTRVPAAVCLSPSQPL